MCVYRSEYIRAGIGGDPYMGERGRYCNASAMWAVKMRSSPPRSAIVLETFSTLWNPRAESLNWFIAI